MAKKSRTYRLSEAALQAVEMRDKLKYPSANDYVEAMIIKEKNEKKTNNIIERLDRIEKKTDILIQILSDEYRKNLPAESETGNRSEEEKKEPFPQFTDFGEGFKFGI